VSSITIKTERLLLKKLKLEDAQTVFLYRSNDAVSRYQKFHPKTLEDAINFITENTKHIDIDDSWFQLGIYLHSGELIGDFGIHFVQMMLFRGIKHFIQKHLKMPLTLLQRIQNI